MSSERDNFENINRFENIDRVENIDRFENIDSAGNRAGDPAADAGRAGRDRGDGVFPPTERAEVAALLRDLAAIGAMRRAQLSSEAEERIFAASDLQLPLAHGDVRPVVGRIAPARGGVVPAWVRVAAAIAVVGSIAAGAILLSRGFADADGLPGQGGATPDRVLVDAGNDPAGGASDAAVSSADAIVRPGVVAIGASAVSPEHYELALAADLGADVGFDLGADLAADLAADVAAMRGLGGLGGFDSLDARGGVARRGDVVEAIDLDFDGLSGEFAAIVARSASGF